MKKQCCAYPEVRCLCSYWMDVLHQYFSDLEVCRLPTLGNFVAHRLTYVKTFVFGLSYWTFVRLPEAVYRPSVISSRSHHLKHLPSYSLTRNSLLEISVTKLSIYMNITYAAVRLDFGAPHGTVLPLWDFVFIFTLIYSIDLFLWESRDFELGFTYLLVYTD